MVNRTCNAVCYWLIFQPPSTNKILITPELWLQQEAAQSAADAEKATGTKRELTQVETQQQGAPLDLNIKVSVKVICQTAMLPVYTKYFQSLSEIG